VCLGESLSLLPAWTPLGDDPRYAVQLTPAGWEALAKGRELSRQVERRLLAPLAVGERKRLHALLARVAGSDL
jgi:hypothetical protein